MPLFSPAQRTTLLANGSRPGTDHRPVVRLYVPDTADSWLLARIDPLHPHLAFGLADTGPHPPELRPIDLRALEASHPSVTCDRYFRATQSLTAYAKDARRHGRIVLYPVQA